MAGILGSNANAIYKIASTWGTAVSGGAGNKIKGEFTPAPNVSMLKLRQMGSGVPMTQTLTRGSFKPAGKLVMDAGYRNCMDNIIAQFMGTAGAPVEQTGAQGDYKHTITLNASPNAKYGTFAYEDSSATVVEFPTTATQGISLSLDEAPGILQFSADLLANNILYSTTNATTNTNGSLASATATDVEPIAYADVDTFRINLASGGALSGSDQLNICGFKLDLSRPQMLKGEIRGAAGLSAPIITDVFQGTMSVTLIQNVDHTYNTYWFNETALKCALNIQGTQIGSGVNKAISCYIPRMILSEPPVYNPVSPGINQVVLNFGIFGATANPTGMTSFYPYFEIINQLSTSLLA